MNGHSVLLGTNRHQNSKWIIMLLAVIAVCAVIITVVVGSKPTAELGKSGIDALKAAKSKNDEANKKERITEAAIRAIEKGLPGYKLNLDDSVMLEEQGVWGVYLTCDARGALDEGYGKVRFELKRVGGDESNEFELDNWVPLE